MGKRKWAEPGRAEDKKGFGEAFFTAKQRNILGRKRQRQRLSPDLDAVGTRC